MEQHHIEGDKQEEKTERKRADARTISRRGKLGLSSEELRNIIAMFSRINCDKGHDKWGGECGAQTDEMERG